MGRLFASATPVEGQACLQASQHNLRIQVQGWRLAVRAQGREEAELGRRLNWVGYRVSQKGSKGLLLRTQEQGELLAQVDKGGSTH
jgi:hypothetical protein